LENKTLSILLSSTHETRGPLMEKEKEEVSLEELAARVFQLEEKQKLTGEFIQLLTQQVIRDKGITELPPKLIHCILQAAGTL